MIIEAKKSPYAIRTKDLVIYPKFASKVVFWCLYIEESIDIAHEEKFVFVSSEDLVEQLEQKVTNVNKRTILRIINDIKKLKDGTLLSQQKLLSDFLK